MTRLHPQTGPVTAAGKEIVSRNATTHARTLVEDAAMARWFLWRKQRAYNTVESALYEVQPEIERWSAEAHHQYALADRYKTAAERALKRALNNLEGLRRQSVQEAARRHRDHQWEAAHQLDCRRLELQEKRYQLAAEYEARLAKREARLATPDASLAKEEPFCLVKNAVSSPRNFAAAPTKPSISEYSPIRTAAANVTGRVPDGILEFSRNISARR
ncbi:MAG TPA: hypothetical protein VGL97_09920 [Bryobacteraceae bacterium]